MLRILVADEQAMFRDALKTCLENEGFEVAGLAGDGREAVHLVRTEHPGIALLDIALPLMNGIDAAREIRRHAPDTRTIALTMCDDREQVLAALDAGMRGYVLKTQGTEELLRGIREVAGGATYLCPAISQIVVNVCLNKGAATPGSPLTERERQTLQLIAEGMSNLETADMLSVSGKTVASHRAHIMRKLCVHNTAGLVRQAVRLGLIKP